MYRLSFQQNLPITLETAWNFFAHPRNLQKIVPSYLGFSNHEEDDSEMYEGQIIIHTIRPMCNIPITWVTEITHIEKFVYFIDEQRVGPYRFWHHEHRFIPHSGGVQMIDTVHYKMPFGIFGRALHALKVKRDVAAIFAYRHKKVAELFASQKDNASL